MKPGTSKNTLSESSEAGNRRELLSGSILDKNDVERTLITANQFQVPFTTREEELQKLLQTERLRGDQRRKNYLQLKDEHLRLQNEHLNIQVELKQLNEEIKHLKDMKNHEVEELLKKLEDKNRQVSRLEKNLKEHDPEILRLKFVEELEEPLRQSEREKNKLENDKTKLQNELKILKLQNEHNESEHLHMIQELKTKYDIEIAQIKAERDEYRSRIAESQLPPDVKRLMDLREENSLFRRKIDEANATIENAKSEYLLIQNQISILAQENTNQIAMFQEEISTLKNEIQFKQKELKKSKAQILNEKSQNEDLLNEIERLKQNESKIKQNLNEFIRESQREKDELQKLFDEERENIKIDLNRLRNEIKNRFEQIQNKEIIIQEMQDKLVQKDRENVEKIRAIQCEDNEKIFQLEQNKRMLEIRVEELENVRTKNKEEMIKNDVEQTRLHEKIIKLQQELFNQQSKIQSYESSIEELQHFRRQHRNLHNETSRLQSENVQLYNQIREIKHQLNISKEDLKIYKDKMQAFKINEQEIRIEHEKVISKLNRKHEQEIQEINDKLNILQKENLKIKNDNKIEHNKLYLLKAKQCNKIASKLNDFLTELKEPQSNQNIKKSFNKFSINSGNKETVQQKVISELEDIHEKLRKLELYSQQLNSLTQSELLKK